MEKIDIITTIAPTTVTTTTVITTIIMDETIIITIAQTTTMADTATIITTTAIEMIEMKTVKNNGRGNINVRYLGNAEAPTRQDARGAQPNQSSIDHEDNY